MNRKLLAAFVIASMAVVAGIDFATSADLVGSILFTFPLALCAAHRSKRLLWGTAAVAALLTVAAELWGFNRGPLLNPAIASVNRGLLAASLFTLAGFIHLWIGRTERIALDATELKRQSQRLAQTEGRYRGLLEAAPDAMVLVNPSGAIVLVNAQAEKDFGYNRDELVGRQLTTIIPDVRTLVPEINDRIAHAIRSGDNSVSPKIGSTIEFQGQRKDGGAFPLEISFSMLQSAEGVLVTVAIRDVTTRKKAEAQLARTMSDLNRSNEDLAQFASIASHDLQEPLRMVASYTQLLSKRYKGKLDADADEFVSYAVDGAQRMQRLIQDLLAYSQVGTRAQHLLNTSSEEALGQALLNLQGAIAGAGALVTHDPLPIVMADEGQLIQLFQNLVGNAIKYRSHEVPRVHVSSTSNDSKNGGQASWLFSVRDNGLGIDARYFDKIFGMFQRLHKRREFAGTGIGLAICKKIVERHGGTITVESQLGHGSTFRFALSGEREMRH
jgi:PAS domain S-box-containing protein